MDFFTSLDHLSGPAASGPGGISVSNRAGFGCPEILDFSIFDLCIAISCSVAEIVSAEGDDSIHICVADPGIEGVGIGGSIIRSIGKYLSVNLNVCGFYV